jgi:hypothetical protein
MIVIEKGTKTVLSPRFHLANNICAYLYDQITEILDAPEYEKMANTDIDFNGDPELRSIFEREVSDPLDILQQFERNAELEVVVTKHLVMSMLSDMVNFIYESIIIAQKGKMSVAYSLIRKPFKDQLCLLEQILVDREEFFQRFFHHGDSSAYDPSAPSLNKRELVKKAAAEINLLALDPAFIYEIRYDRSIEWGLSALSDKAIHIVTSNKNYKTPNQDMNFIYVTPEQVEDLHEHYYFAVPQLMIYTTAVIDDIVFGLIPYERSLRLEKKLKRFLAQIMLMDHPGGVESKKVYRFLSSNLKSICPICGHRNRYTKRDFIGYFFEHAFYCKKCFNQVPLSEELLDFLADFFHKSPEAKVNDAE